MHDAEQLTLDGREERLDLIARVADLFETTLFLRVQSDESLELEVVVFERIHACAAAGQAPHFFKLMP